MLHCLLGADLMIKRFFSGIVAFRLQTNAWSCLCCVKTDLNFLSDMKDHGMNFYLVVVPAHMLSWATSLHYFLWSSLCRQTKPRVWGQIVVKICLA